MDEQRLPSNTPEPEPRAESAAEAFARLDDRVAGLDGRIALMAHERSRGFRFVLADGQLDLSASNPDLGEARELLPIEYSGERFETAFNARYLLDVLGAMTSKEIAIELSEELSPAQIRPADDADESAVIMPMRL